jgi:hypothetical protein
MTPGLTGTIAPLSFRMTVTYVKHCILYGSSTTGMLALGFHGILTLPRTSCNALTFPSISGKASLPYANYPTKSWGPTSGNRKAGNVLAAFAAQREAKRPG